MLLFANIFCDFAASQEVQMKKGIAIGRPCATIESIEN